MWYYCRKESDQLLHYLGSKILQKGYEKQIGIFLEIYKVYGRIKISKLIRNIKYIGGNGD